MAIDPETGLIGWIPSRDQIGTTTVIARVTDELGGVAVQTFDLQVSSVNDAPGISSRPTGPAGVNALWSYQVEASDPNGDAIVYRLDQASLDRGMTIDADGLLTWTAPGTGDFRVEITVDDQRGGTITQQFILPVRDNAAPIFNSNPPAPAIVGEQYTYNIDVTDPNSADVLTLTLDEASLARGMVLTGTTLTWTAQQLGDVPVTITAADGKGAETTQSFTLPVQAAVVASEPPQITSSPTGPAFEGQTWSYTIMATDADDDDSTLVYSLENPGEQPTVIEFDPVSHTLTWTPTSADVGTSTSFTLRVTDPQGAWREQTFSVPAVAVPVQNDPPEITSIPTGPAVLGEAYAYQVTAYDPEGETLTYSLDATAEAAGVSIDADTGLLTWTNPATVGDQAISVTVTDEGLNQVTQTFTLPVVSNNHGPEIISVPVGPAYTDEVWQYHFVATDADNDTLTYTLVLPTTPPATVNFNATTNTLSWTPLTGEQDRSFTIQVSDGNGGVTTQSFTIPAVRRNTAPEITSIPSGPAVEGELWTYTIGATDPEGDTLTYSLVSPETLPAGVSFDASSGTISWTPISSQNPDGLSFTVRVDDGFEAYAEQSFTIPVVSPPTPPVGGGTLPEITSTPAGPVYQDELWNYNVTYDELDGDPNITFDVEINAAGEDISIDANGLVSWTPAAQGRFTITVTVDDNADGIATQTFDVDVQIHNLPPEITSTPTTNVRVNEYWSYLVQATDPNGDTLTYSLDQDSLNRGMSIDSTTGRILWTANSVGEFPVEVTVDDGFGLTAVQSFTIGVNNAAPKISSQPTGPAYVGSQWSYQVEATDEDGQSLQYSLLSPTVLPDDMQIDANGLLTWTPTSAGPVDIEIEVSDGFDGSRTQSFTLAVEAVVLADDAPVIRSLPTNSIRAGEVYQYQVDAYDPNGDPVAITFETRPAGMTVDASGLISWRPDVLGDYDVTIKAADPAGNFITQSWTITVLAPVQLNDPPEITSRPTGPAVRDRLYTYQATATDANGDTITWSLSPTMTVVGDMAIDASTGAFTWTPTAKGSFDITVVASDGTDAVTQTFTLAVLNNAPPVITSTPSQNVDINTAYSYTVVASDPNADDTLTITLENPPAGVSLTQTDNNTASLTWTPTVAGIHTITILATDQDGEVAQQEYEVRVTDPFNNTAPQIISSPRDRIVLEQEFLYQFQANDVDGDSLTWTLTTAPDGMTMDDQGLLRWTPTADDVDGSPHSYTVVVSDGSETDTATYSLNVTTTLNNGRAEFTTNPTTNLVAHQPYVYDADATDPENDTLIYSLTKAPEGMTINAETGLVQWTPTLDNLGKHTMTVRVLDTMGAGIEQTVTLTVRSVNRTPMLAGDPPTEGYTNKQYTYAVRATDPDGDALSYSVSAQDASGNPVTGIAVDGSGLVTWTPTTAGTYRLSVSVVDEHGLGAVKIYDVVVHDSSVVTQTSPPSINSHAPRIASSGETYSYLVDARDPDGDAITLSLDAASLARGMTFNPDNVREIIWTDPATVGQVYWATLTATTVDGSATETFAVTVMPANTPPTVDDVPLATVTAGNTFRYDMRVNDPDGDRISYKLLLAPEGLTIDEFGRMTWETTAQTPLQDYTVDVMVSDGRGGQFLHEFTVRVQADTQAPRVTILTNPQQGKVGEELVISVSAFDNVDVDRIELRIDGQIVVLNGGIARFTPTSVGTYHITATAWDTSGNEGAATPVDLLTIDPADQNPPSVDITSLSYYQEITAPIDIVGSVTDDSLDNLTWTLSAIPHDGGEAKVFATGSGAITNDVLGKFDPTLLRNGVYTIELKATDAGGNVSVDSEVIKVDGNLKLGNFNVSFVDLQVPIVGIPITVTRTYDTLDSDVQGDFGYGWSMDLSNTKVRIVQPESSDPGLFGYSPIQDGTRIIITLPDGTEEGFTFRPERQVSGFIKTADYLPMFVPDVGVKSELIVDARYIRKLGDAYIDMETGRGYSPADPILGGAYTLILRNGVELAINAETGDLSTITDLSGNQITFTGMGIESNAGRSIEFERDYAGRITAIIDPARNRLEYAYDVDGNLISFTDRSDATTQFTYLNGVNDPEHYLDEIIDPLGRTASKSVYDADGRLISMVDAEGNTIEYDWDGDSKVQKITNQLGFISIITLDDRGNVIREINPIGGTVLHTYDSNDNVLSETIVVGLEDTEENGENNDLIKTNKYDSDGNLIQSTDNDGNTSYSEYTDTGLVRNSTDYWGNTSYTNFNSRGLPSSMVNRLGRKTGLSYNDKGNVTNLDDDKGNTFVTSTYNKFGEVLTAVSALTPDRTIYTDYDINGNQIAKWHFDSNGSNQVQILTLNHFDKNNQFTGEIRAEIPEGSFITSNFDAGNIPTEFIKWTTSIEYTLTGAISASVDRDGVRTEFLYDDRGQKIETRTRSVDQNGNISELVSRTVYDAAGRAIATTEDYSEGSDELIQGILTSYDSAGQATKTEITNGIDISLLKISNSFRTVLKSPGSFVASNKMDYDIAGRSISTTDNFGLSSEISYNTTGHVIETRQEKFDESGSKVGLISHSVYDEYGRVSISTDLHLEGSSDPVLGTQNIYDQLGRLVKTIRLEGVQIAVVGNETELIASGTTLWQAESIYNTDGKLSKTISADGTTTETIYDSFGRTVVKLGPSLSLSEANLSNHTLATTLNPPVSVQLRAEIAYDGEGNITEQQNNILQFTLADGSVEIDDSNVNTTIFEYDVRNNLIKTTFNDGSFISTSYDNNDRVISEINQSGLTRTFEYDAQGELIVVELPAVFNPQTGAFESPKYKYVYDAEGHQIALIDPLGHETQFEYDNYGNQTERVLPLGFGPDGAFNTADDSSLPEGSFKERYEYDNLGRTKLHISFEGVITQYIYDDLSGMLVEQRFFANETDYANGSGTPSEIWTSKYDAFGRQIEIIQDSDGDLQTVNDQRVTTNVFDNQGRLSQVSTDEGIIVYEYDILGRKTSSSIYTAGSDPEIDTPERVTTYTYDSLSRLSTVSDDLDPLSGSDQPLTTSYQYDILGNLKRVDLPNDFIEEYTYDDLNRLDKLTHYVADSSPDDLTDNPKAAEFDYTTRPDGKRSGVTETFWMDSDGDGNTEEYINQINWTYDDAGRLIDEVFNHYDDLLDQSGHFSYDLSGNRLEQQVEKNIDGDGIVDKETISYSYDANDRLTSELAEIDLNNDGSIDQTSSTTYSYTGTQQTGKIVKESGLTKTTTAFTYDLQGRMDTVTITSLDSSGQATRIEKTTYQYDATGIRVFALHEIDTDGDTNGDTNFDERTRTEYLNDHYNFTGYEQVIKETQYNADNGQKTKVIEYSFGHDEIAQTVTKYDEFENVSSEETHIFGHDGHGSVRVLYDLAAMIEQLFAFDSYGKLLSIHNGISQFTSANASDALTSLLYSGEQFDSRIGQQYLRARYYDPSTGRFNRLDPFFGDTEDPQSFHKYLYTHGDPINHIDPSGLVIGGLIGLVSSIGNTLTTQAQNAGAAFAALGSATTFAEVASAVSTIGIFLNTVHDSLSIIFTIWDLLHFDPGDILDIKKQLESFTNTSFTPGLGALQVDMPSVLDVKLPFKFRGKMAAIFGNNPVGTKVSEMFGEIAAAGIAKALGMEVKDIPVGYHGFDSVMYEPLSDRLMILEAKGNTAKLANTQGGQMRDKWITNRIKKMIKKDDGSEIRELEDHYNKVQLGTKGMWAMVVKTTADMKNITSLKMSMHLQIRTYKGINSSWGKPLE